MPVRHRVELCNHASVTVVHDRAHTQSLWRQQCFCQHRCNIALRQVHVNRGLRLCSVTCSAQSFTPGSRTLHSDRMFGPMHRLLLPCLYQYENSWCNSSSCSSSQHSGHQGVVEQRCQLHKQPDAARPLPPLPPVSQLTTEQKKELKQAAVDRWGRVGWLVLLPRSTSTPRSTGDRPTTLVLQHTQLVARTNSTCMCCSDRAFSHFIIYVSCCCSFKQDPQAASRLLAKNLSDDAKRHLLAALECSKAPPDLSRSGKAC